MPLHSAGVAAPLYSTECGGVSQLTMALRTLIRGQRSRNPRSNDSAVATNTKHLIRSAHCITDRVDPKTCLKRLPQQKQKVWLRGGKEPQRKRLVRIATLLAAVLLDIITSDPVKKPPTTMKRKKRKKSPKSRSPTKTAVCTVKRNPPRFKYAVMNAVRTFATTVTGATSSRPITRFVCAIAVMPFTVGRATKWISATTVPKLFAEVAARC